MSNKPTKANGSWKGGRPPRHGAYSLMAKEDALERHPRVRAYLSDVREGLIRDLGPGEDDLTTAQLALINHTISKLGVLRLIEEHIQSQGVFSVAGLLDPALGKFWLAASNSLRLDLMALGLNTRKGKEPLDLGLYKAGKIREKAARAVQDAAAGQQACQDGRSQAGEAPGQGPDAGEPS